MVEHDARAAGHHLVAGVDPGTGHPLRTVDVVQDGNRPVLGAECMTDRYKNDSKQFGENQEP